MFFAGNIDFIICHWVAKSSKIDSFGSQILLGANTQKSLRSVLLPTDTRHVLKFRKGPFRGVDGRDSSVTNR